MSETLRLSADQYQAIINHARACKPEEACGILAGEADGVAKKVFLMENAEHSDVFYTMDSREQFEVFDAIERDGLKLLAIFHSHPHSPPLPSAQDLELAFYPDAFYLIISLMHEEPQAGVFRIVDGRIEEAELALGGEA